MKDTLPGRRGLHQGKAKKDHHKVDGGPEVLQSPKEPEKSLCSTKETNNHCRETAQGASKKTPGSFLTIWVSFFWHANLNKTDQYLLQS